MGSRKTNSQPIFSLPEFQIPQHTPEHRRQKQTGQEEELRGCEERLRAKEVGKDEKEQSPGSTGPG